MKQNWWRSLGICETWPTTERAEYLFRVNESAAGAPFWIGTELRREPGLSILRSGPLSFARDWCPRRFARFRHTCCGPLVGTCRYRCHAAARGVRFHFPVYPKGPADY